MLLNLFAIADMCFLIDWSYWRYRDVLFELFKTVFIPENVLREVKSENTLDWITSNLAKGKLALYTETPDIVEFATRIMEKSRLIPGLRGVDLPEAICLAVGKRRGYIVLTENRGALMAVDILEELSSVRVWRSLEVIVEAIKKKLIPGNPVDIFKSYEEDTKHFFPRRELGVIINELRGETREVA